MSNTSPTVKSSQTVFEGRVFKVTVDRVGYPDGRTVTMDVIRHPGSVVLIAMPSPDRVILVQQYRYVVDRWLWEFPAGTIDPGEDPEVWEASERRDGRRCGRSRAAYASRACDCRTLFDGIQPCAAPQLPIGVRI